MTIARCLRCGATATAKTFEAARRLLDHAIGLRKGKPCGDSKNKVVEIKTEVSKIEKAVENKVKTKVKKIEESIKSEIKPKNTYSKSSPKKDNTFNAE